MKKMILVFSFVFAFLVFGFSIVDAKISSNSIFEVSIGEETLPIYYTLVETETDGIKERMQFNVELKGLSAVSNSYKWEHNLCYKISGYDEICEVDITGDGDSKIYSNSAYSYYFYDGDMPFYDENILFEYVTFKNKFVCIDCDESSEFSLDDITFVGSEINYKYSYDVKVNTVSNDGRDYVKNYYSSSNKLVYVGGTFVNNGGSNLIFEGAPTYKIINEVCVGEDVCVSDEIDEVYSSSDTYKENPYKITPFLGNLDFYYNGSNLIYVDNVIEYEFARFKTRLECLTNCDSRRVENSILLNDSIYYFDYTKPEVDTSNTVVDSYSEVNYIKSSDVKITVVDNQSGIDETKLKYYIVKPYSSYCTLGSENAYSFVNGEVFSIGSGLSGGYCMYYVAYDKNGNYIKSDYYIYYFDNSGPDMKYENIYDANSYYSLISLSPTFSDLYSGLSDVYYYWSKEIISVDNYLNVKNNGKLYEGVVSSSELVEDGQYYLYFLGYDNLGNYKLHDLGGFNIDTKALELEEVVVEKEDISTVSSIKVIIDQIEDVKEFKCGFFDDSEVVLEMLNLTCYNNQVLKVPTGYEGIYSFYIYAPDRAANYSLLNVLSDFNIDTKGPSISSQILYNDDIYRIINEITLNVTDLSGVNESSLKYGWFSTSKSGVLSSDLTSTFVSGEAFGYPPSYYGEYKLYVSALDNLGNETFISLDKIFKVDTDIIRISLVGEESIVLLLGQEYKELGAKAYKGDVAHGGRVGEVVIDGSVNIYKTGTYYITYSCGEGDLRVSVIRTVFVRSDVNYKVIGIGLFVIGVVITGIRLFVRRKNDEKYDNFDIK